MAKRTKRIKYKKERVVLSDVLPYEIPITFSNRHFYSFLVKHKISISNGNLEWLNNDNTFIDLLNLLFNTPIKDKNDIQVNEKSSNIELGNRWLTKPFNFNISHKNHEFRQLTLIHPINQLSMVDFYNTYKELILYYCNKSEFSIRKPTKVAKYTYFNDSIFKQKKAEEPNREILEEYDKEYDNLKSFFVYRKYSNIHKFYESYTYQRNEKKFKGLLKFDVSKCFDSIYTHSIAWALMDKEVIKEHIKLSGYTFGGVFDTALQRLNYNETNGIVIGPEFSRIFAEIILQKIDFDVQAQLQKEKISHLVDYSVHRYVDDYFLFYQEEKVKNRVFELFKIELKKYNFFVNESKSIEYEKPLITELTIAKEKISDFLGNSIELKSKEIEKTDNDDEQVKSDVSAKSYSLYFNARKSIIHFKTIVKESNIEYKSILNYAFAIVDRKVFKMLKEFDKAKFIDKEKENSFKVVFVKNLVEILDFVFFLYSVSPRVNTTIRLSSIITKLIKYIKRKKSSDKKRYFNSDLQDLLLKKIFDDVNLILNNNRIRNRGYTQIETLYLLIILNELGRDYRLDKNTLGKYLNIKIESDSTSQNEDKYIFPYEYNYWTISVILFYIGNKKRYNTLKEELKEHIISILREVKKEKLRSNAEYTIMLFDLIVCPYLDDNFKRKILEYFIDSGTNKSDLIEKIKEQKFWFTQWYDFDLDRELNTKRSQEVY